jgi:enamine deaminase RidA (YjgF/YER057c/UK114 family)
VIAMMAITAACSAEQAAPSTSGSLAGANEGCAHVVDVVVTADDGTHTFDVTVESADTGWEKYADAWEVRAPTGEVLGVRELAHPHVDEQPFTRSLSGVVLPDGVGEVTVAARDSLAGFCGETVTVTLSQ